MSGLNVSDVVRVDVNLSPMAVPLRSFGSLCIAGASNVIDVKERIREYTTLDGVAADFGSTAPEYLAADLFFSQAPQPALLYIGRFARVGTQAILHGGLFNAAQAAALLASMQKITDGTFQITINGTVRTVKDTSAYLRCGVIPVADQAALVTALKAHTAASFQITIDGVAVPHKTTNLTAISTTPSVGLPEVATQLTSTITPHGTVTWDATANHFLVTSATKGTNSKISFASTPTGGQDVSVQLKMTQVTGAVTVQGTAGMNFTGITNLNGAASIIATALAGGGCRWDGSRFHITSDTTGTTSTIGYATSAGVGQDISSTCKLRVGQALPPVNGHAPETPLQCAIALRKDPSWYGLSFATFFPTASLNDAEHVAVAEFIEGCNPISIYGYTTSDDGVIDPASTLDIASQMKSLGLMRTVGQYSTSNPYAICSLLGRAFSTDFEGNNTTITLKFKQEPGVVPELLTETEAAALQHKHCNVFVQYSNDTAIIQEGVMANGFFFDEVHGTDWLANRIQTDVYNVLYTAPTKIPQTNQGVHILVTTVENSLAQGVTNGLIAPGQWNAPGFGQIDYGQMLPKGYYVWAPLVESQPQAIREQRIAPTIQCAIKLAGAIHRAYVIVNVNR